MSNHAMQKLAAEILAIPVPNFAWSNGTYETVYKNGLRAAAELVASQAEAPTPNVRIGTLLEMIDYARNHGWPTGACERIYSVAVVVKRELAAVAQAPVVPVVPEGWVMVPRVPTEEMVDAMVIAQADEQCGVESVYRTALAAAPSPSSPPEPAGQDALPVAWRYRFHTDASLAGGANRRSWVLRSECVEPSPEFEVEALYNHPPLPVDAVPHLSPDEIEVLARQGDDADGLMLATDLLDAVRSAKTNGSALAAILKYRKANRLHMADAIEKARTTHPASKESGNAN